VNQLQPRLGDRIDGAGFAAGDPVHLAGAIGRAFQQIPHPQPHPVNLKRYPEKLVVLQQLLADAGALLRQLAISLSKRQPLLQLLGSQLRALLRQPPHSPTENNQDQEK
jgi:hypothetical protein